jgi:hypothetical protein
VLAATPHLTFMVRGPYSFAIADAIALRHQYPYIGRSKKRHLMQLMQIARRKPRKHMPSVAQYVVVQIVISPSYLFKQPWRAPRANCK